MGYYIAAIKTKYKEIVNPKWLEIYLNSITKKYVVAKEGNGKLEIVQMKNIPVIIPDLKEQEEIVKEYTNNQKIIYNIQDKLIFLNKQLENIKAIREKSNSYKLGELFSLFQGHQLTDKFIYDNVGKVPVISGSNKVKGFIDTALINTDNLPCIIYQTKGNKSFSSIIMREPFNANNTAVLIPKENRKELYNIEFIQMFLYKNMQEIVNSESGISYIDTKILDTFVYLPSLNIQNDIYIEYKELTKTKEKLESIIQKYTL